MHPFYARGCKPGCREPQRQYRTRRRVPAASASPSLRGLVVSLVLSVFVVGRVSGWKDCVVSPEDKWKPATERIPALRMRYDYERRYTCDNIKASFVAASFFFDSPCMAKNFFYPPEVHSCLRGRRVIFLGDSLSNQQGDSLLGMLGWHPDWMTKGHPQNMKQAVDKNGARYNTMVDCWHPEEGGVTKPERCYDYSTKDFLLPDASNKPSVEGGGDGGDEISVHMRMFSYPQGRNWLNKAVRDYNETRPSDVFVVNFGAHYHDNPEDDEKFRADMSPILDAMADLGEQATVVWREIAPTHFPARNGSYDAFDQLNAKGHKRYPCCTGIPPKVLDRNLWVEDYLRDNGLADRVKLLRIYDMSLARGAAHHTCNCAPPSTMDQKKSNNRRCQVHGSTDCRHWSEPGVVEEWNGLLLNHLCGTSELA